MTITIVGNIASIITLFMISYVMLWHLPTMREKIQSLEEKVKMLEAVEMPSSVKLLNRLKKRAAEREERSQ